MAKFSYELHDVNVEDFCFAIFSKKKITSIILLIKYLVNEIISKRKVFILFALISFS